MESVILQGVHESSAWASRRAARRRASRRWRIGALAAFALLAAGVAFAIVELTGSDGNASPAAGGRATEPESALQPPEPGHRRPSPGSRRRPMRPSRSQPSAMSSWARSGTSRPTAVARSSTASTRCSVETLFSGTSKGRSRRAAPPSAGTEVPTVSPSRRPRRTGAGSPVPASPSSISRTTMPSTSVRPGSSRLSGR